MLKTSGSASLSSLAPSAHSERIHPLVVQRASPLWLRRHALAYWIKARNGGGAVVQVETFEGLQAKGVLI